MKLLWFHLMPYTELPDDFTEKHESVWVDISAELFDPARALRDLDLEQRAFLSPRRGKAARGMSKHVTEARGV